MRSKQFYSELGFINDHLSTLYQSIGRLQLELYRQDLTQASAVNVDHDGSCTSSERQKPSESSVPPRSSDGEFKVGDVVIRRTGSDDGPFTDEYGVIIELNAKKYAEWNHLVWFSKTHVVPVHPAWLRLA